MKSIQFYENIDLKKHTMQQFYKFQACMKDCKEATDDWLQQWIYLAKRFDNFSKM